MKKFLARFSLLALVAMFIMPGMAKADFTYSRNKTGPVVIGPVTFTVSVDSVEDLNCNPGEDDFWYVGTYSTSADTEYYPDVSEILPTSDLSGSFTVDMPTGAAITHVWTACLTSNEDYSTENGGLLLEQSSVLPGVDLAFLVL